VTGAEAEAAARLLEGLLTDPVLRQRFRRDPVAASREAGVESLAREMSFAAGKAMETLDERESRSSLAGVFMAAALEGAGGFDVLKDVVPHVEQVPESVGQVLSRVDLPAIPGMHVETAQAAPPDNAAGEFRAVLPEVRAGRAGGGVDPAQFGQEGTGGPAPAEDVALLHNKRVTLDADGIADLKSGKIDPRVASVLTAISRNHEITVSAMMSDHDKNTSGGSVSNHYYGRAFDVATVDGQPVGPGNQAARQVAMALSRLDPSIRPSEIGSPWALPGSAYFTDGAHQNHLHVAFDDPIARDWRPPGDLGAGGTPQDFPDDSSQGSVDDSSQDSPDGSSPDFADSISPDPGDGADDDIGGEGGDEPGGLEDPGGDTNAEADAESDGDGGDEEDGDADDSDESDESDENSDESDEGPDGDHDDSSDSGSDDTDDSDGSDGGGSDDSGISDSGSGVSGSGDTGADGDSSGDLGGGSPLDLGDVAGGYPGESASQAEIAAWMGSAAQKRGLPPELPVMAGLVESNLRNVPLGDGDADSAGFFQMRVSIWNRGPYAGYADRPELQLNWFLDKAEAVKREGRGSNDPGGYGEWIANVENPAAQYRGRYQLRLEEARSLLKEGMGSRRNGGGGGDDGVQLEQVGQGGVRSAGPRALAALAEARRYTGTPYRWGGSSPKTGFDCSGLVQWAYAKAGIKIPRVTDQQFEAPGGSRVGRRNLLPGDLVFFRDPSGYIHHVGISLGGDKFLHAPQTGDVVKTSSLNESYYAQQFAGGRRFDQAGARKAEAAAAVASGSAPHGYAPGVDPDAAREAEAAVARDAAEVQRAGTVLWEAVRAQEARKANADAGFFRAVRPRR
jgi:NlpC/P60 family